MGSPSRPVLRKTGLDALLKKDAAAAKAVYDDQYKITSLGVKNAVKEKDYVKRQVDIPGDAMLAKHGVVIPYAALTKQNPPQKPPRETATVSMSSGPPPKPPKPPGLKPGGKKSRKPRRKTSKRKTRKSNKKVSRK